MASQAAYILCYEYTIDYVYTYLKSLPFLEKDLERLSSGLSSGHDIMSRSRRIIKEPQIPMSPMASAKVVARSRPMDPKPVAASCATTDSKN